MHRKSLLRSNNTPANNFRPYRKSSIIDTDPDNIVLVTSPKNTFFKNESKKIQSVSDVPESSPDLGYKSER